MMLPVFFRPPAAPAHLLSSWQPARRPRPDRPISRNGSISPRRAAADSDQGSSSHSAPVLSERAFRRIAREQPIPGAAPDGAGPRAPSNMPPWRRRARRLDPCITRPRHPWRLGARTPPRWPSSRFAQPRRGSSSPPICGSGGWMPHQSVATSSNPSHAQAPRRPRGAAGRRHRRLSRGLRAADRQLQQAEETLVDNRSIAARGGWRQSPTANAEAGMNDIRLPEIAPAGGGRRHRRRQDNGSDVYDPAEAAVSGSSAAMA